MTEFPKPWGNYLLDDLIAAAPPEPNHWWPQTLGWQVVGVLILLWLVRECYGRWQEYQRDAYRRAALAWLVKLDVNPEPEQLRQLPALLKKTAIAGFERCEVASLSGREWELWLDQHCDRTGFSQLHASQLQRITYGPEIDLADEAIQALRQEITVWVKHHRRPYA